MGIGRLVRHSPPISVADLRGALDSGTEIEDIELTRTILVTKGEKSRASNGLTMPLGGARLSGEGVQEAARRRISLETLLYPLGGEWWKGHPIFQPIKAFTTARRTVGFWLYWFSSRHF